MKVLVSIAAVFFAMSFSASAQPPDRSKVQGYVFAAPGVGSIDSSKGNIHIGAGGEGFIYKGLGIGAEIGGVCPLSTTVHLPGRPNSRYGGFCDGVVGLGSANLSYHLLPRTTDRRLEPFVTVGYSLFFRAGLSHGYNAGGGINVWLNKHVATRFEIRNQHSRRHETVSFRIGVTFR